MTEFRNDFDHNDHDHFDHDCPVFPNKIHLMFGGVGRML